LQEGLVAADALREIVVGSLRGSTTKGTNFTYVIAPARTKTLSKGSWRPVSTMVAVSGTDPCATLMKPPKPAVSVCVPAVDGSPATE